MDLRQAGVLRNNFRGLWHIHHYLNKLSQYYIK